MKKWLFLTSSLLLLSGTSLAQEKFTKEIILEKSPHLKKLIETGNGTVDLLDIHDLPSLYEVILSTQDGIKVAYLTKDLKYLILGSIFDHEGKNLTHLRLKELNRIEFKNLPLNDALKFSSGNGTKKLALFMDPFCPYCKALLEYLKTKNDFTLYVYFNPISEKSLETIKNIICNEKSTSTIDILLNQEAIDVKDDKTEKTTKKDCPEAEEILEKHLLLGQLLRVRAVPFVILEDGHNFYGVDRSTLEEFFKK